MTYIRENIRAAFLTRDDCPYVNRIFDQSRCERIRQSALLLPAVLTPKNFDQYRKDAKEIEILFTFWSFPDELLLDPKNFPALQAVFYLGGSINGFARPLLNRGIHVVAARKANAVSVAQFCLAQIILSCKGYFRNTRHCRRAETAGQSTAFIGAGLYGKTISLLGMGTVARELMTLLRHFDLNVLAVDPYLTKEEADKLGVKLATMEEAFAQAYVVSNHLPDLPQLKGVLNRALFSSMRRNASFINTGRGAQVNESDLIEIARERPDLTALLDVTVSEPPESGSPLYELANIQLSSHMAGALNDDLQRFGDFAIEEFERYAQGKPLRYADTLEMLNRLA